MPLYPLPYIELIPELKKAVHISKSFDIKFDILSLPKLKLQKEIIIDELTTKNVLKLIPAEKLTFEHAFIIARYCWTEQIPCSDFIQWNNNKWIFKNYDDEIIKSKIRFWESIWNADSLGKYAPFNFDKLKSTFIKSFYRNLLKCSHLDKFTKTFIIPAPVLIDRLSQAEFNNSEKIAIINIGMGAGKSISA